MLSKKQKKILNYVAGPLLFLITSFFIYKQVSNKKDLEKQWEHIAHNFQTEHLVAIIFVLLLMIVNWCLETQKWLVAIKGVQSMKFGKAFKSILSGVAFTMITPNRTGEFVGRVLYIEEGNRIRAALLTLTTSISQTIVTIIFGIIGFFLIKDEILKLEVKYIHLWVNGILFSSVFFIIACLLFYYNLANVIRLFSRYRFFHKFKFFIKPLLKLKTSALNSIFVLSIVRYFVFTLQYIILLHVFDVQINWLYAFAVIAVFYLAMAIIPTFAIAELGIRGGISLSLFGMFSANNLGILFAATGIWLVNVILPAAIGALLILNIKLFKKNIDDVKEV